MKAIIGILSTLAAAATATAIPANGYTPPSDMSDGAFFVTFDDAGNAVTTKADTGEVVAREVLPSSNLESRNIPTTPFDCSEGTPASCTGYDLNANDYATVQHCMDNFLDRTQGNGGYGYGVFYCRAGNALLAVCNYSGVNYGQTAEINTFNGIIDGQCGNYRSGYVFIKAWNKTYVSQISKDAIIDSSSNGHNSGEQTGVSQSAQMLEGPISVTM
jgi:hypothetical protein